MGKKSKRRGGTGGGRKGRHAGAGAGAGDVDDQLTASAAAGPAPTPAEAVALLENVSPPPSLKGIVSTNDDPGKCALCSDLIALGGERTIFTTLCCGKLFCDVCARADGGTALDLLGEKRCTFCNCKASDLMLRTLLSREPWAHYAKGLVHYHSEDLLTNGAFDCMVKAASQGHPEAFLRLSELCRGERGHPRDLVAAKAFAKKARSIHPDLRLASNNALLEVAEGHLVAKEYFEDGAAEEVMGILSDIAKETDPDALDAKICTGITEAANRIGQDQLAGDMSAKAFCYGVVESALCASDCYALSENFALGKLWLSVACKTKSGYAVGKPGTWSQSKVLRDGIRSKLREISDSCGGCGDALEGDTRKYCRGCKAFCYCSRECQKLHWNRADADGGHSTECKEAQDQARKILEAIESGKVDLSPKKSE